MFSFYLNYWGNAEVRNVNSQNWRAGDETYICDDVFTPQTAFRVHYPEVVEKVEATADELRPQCRMIHNDQFGGIWIVDESQTR